MRYYREEPSNSLTESGHFGNGGVFVILLLLILLSIPRVAGVEAADFDDAATPHLREKWENLSMECALQNIQAGSVLVVTVRNIWGQWSLSVLPVYVTDVRTAPNGGQVDWIARLYILSDWSEECVFTDICDLKLKDFRLQLHTGKGAFVLPYADVYSGLNLDVEYDMWYTDVVSITNAITCSEQQVIIVKYHVTTSGVADGNQTTGNSREETAQFCWNYTLHICGKDIFTCTDATIEQTYTLGA